MDEKLFEGLTEEQKEAFKKCKTSEEIMELAAKEKIELNDAQLEAVSGGCSVCKKLNIDVASTDL